MYDWSGKTILIAEDDDYNFLLLETLLKETKVTITRACDGCEVIALCRKVDIDLILMDINMPRMSGIEATIKIRESNYKIPIIAQTANYIDDCGFKYFKSGVNDLLTKPIQEKVLKSKIEKFFK